MYFINYLYIQNYVWSDLFSATQSIDPIDGVISLRVVEIDSKNENEYKQRMKNPLAGKAEVSNKSSAAHNISSLFKGAFKRK